MRFVFAFFLVATVGVNAMKPDELTYELVETYGQAPNVLADISKCTAEKNFNGGASVLEAINSTLRSLGFKKDDLYFRGGNSEELCNGLEKIYREVAQLYDSTDSPYDKGYPLSSYVNSVALGKIWWHWNYLMGELSENSTPEVAVVMNVWKSIILQYIKPVGAETM